MSSVFRVIRFSLRNLYRNPSVTATTVVTLALGIGVATTVGSLVSALLLRPLPFADPDQLVTLWETHPRQADDFRVASAGAVRTWSEQLDELSQIAYSRPWNPLLSTADRLVSLDGVKISADFLPLLGIEPLFGRAFSPADCQPGAEPVVLLGHGVWQGRFGGDPNAVGTSIHLEGSDKTTSATVIGVLPPRLRLDEPLLSRTPDIWSPLTLEQGDPSFGQRYFRVIGRLSTSADLQAARSHLEAISRALQRLHPESNADWGASIESVSRQLTAPIRPALLLLSAAVGFALLVACCNVAVLLLSQASTRQQEIAVRLALGARPRQIGRQVFGECVLLAAFSGLLGLLLARGGLLLAKTYAPETLLRCREVWLDYRAFSLALFASLLVLVFFAMAPAVRQAGVDGYRALRESGRGNSAQAGGRPGKRIRQALVLTEIALSLVLLIAAALMFQSYQRLAGADLGFTADGVWTMRLQLPRSLYPTARQLDGHYSRLVEDISALPEVEVASLVNHLPMQGTSMTTNASAESAPDAQCRVEFRGIDAGYFRALGIPLVAGTDFAPQRLDRQTLGGGHRQVILSQSAAQCLWPGEEAVGRQAVIDWGPGLPSEVLGVVGDVRHHGVRSAIQPTVYMPYSAVPHNSLTLVVRGASHDRITEVVRARAHRLNPTFVIDQVQPLARIVGAGIAEPRSRAILTVIFASIALALAAGGTYSVVAYSVAQRRYDFSVRQALGARPRQLVSATVIEAVRQAAIGVAIGLFTSLLLTRALSGMLYGVSRHDPWILLGMTTMMTAVVLIATYIPVSRAMRIDPATDLRAG